MSNARDGGSRRPQGAPRRRGAGTGDRNPAGGTADDALDEGERDSLIDVPGGVRLQKVLAAAGLGSRRHCEELIGEGRVEVDGETVRRYGARVDPEHQVIRVDGLRIPSRQDLVYLALNKPAGVLTTMSDDRGRRTVSDLLGDREERLYHVGRLDYETEGLMLFTNDGDLAHRLTHPRYGVPKTYLADVPGPVERDLGRRLLAGIELDDGVASADKFRVVERFVRDGQEVRLTQAALETLAVVAYRQPVSRSRASAVRGVNCDAVMRTLTLRVGKLYAAVDL